MKNVRWYSMLTVEVILAVALGLAFYDIWVGVEGGTDSTISWVIWCGSRRWPTIPFAAGYLCGHLFAQMTDSPAAIAVKATVRFVGRSTGVLEHAAA
jgi:hypothetical protein